MKEIKNYEEKLGLTGNDPLGESAYIVEMIEKLETKLQVGLDYIYENMPDYFFKAMRRILPCKSIFSHSIQFIYLHYKFIFINKVTNTKMEWNATIPKVIGSLKQ